MFKKIHRLFREMAVLDWKINKALKKQGYFSNQDMLKAGLSAGWTKCYVYFLKRSNHYEYYYLADDGNKYEYRIDAPESMQKNLKTCFVPYENGDDEDMTRVRGV